MKKSYKNSIDSFLTPQRTIVKAKNKNRHFYEGKFILILIFLFPGFGIVRGQKIDSLKSLLKVKYGVERCDILYQLAYEYVDVDDQIGLQYATKALKAAKEYGDSLRIVKAGRIKSIAFRRLDETDSAIILFTEILPIAMRNNYTDEMKHILNGLGVAYTFKAEYDRALKFHLQSLQIRDKYGNKFEVSVTLNNIGMVYYKLEDYDKSLSYFQQSLKLKNEIKNKHDLEIVLINISLCHAYKGNFSEAQNFVDEAFALCNNKCSKYSQMHGRFSLGLISLGLKNFVDAETQFLSSYKSSKELDDEQMQLDNIVYLSQIYIQTNKINEAKNLLEDAEKLILSGVSYNLGLIQLYSELFTLYSKSGDFEKVALYQQKYIQLKDSIYSEELTRNLMKVEAEYLERENKAKIDAQSKILALNEEVIFRQQFVNLFIGIIALLLIALAIVLVRNNRRKRMINLLLEQKVKERTIELEQNRDVLQRSLEERSIQLQKISTDIKNSLATIKGLCFLGLKDSDAPQYIHKIDVTSDQLLKTLNRTFSNAILVD